MEILETEAPPVEQYPTCKDDAYMDPEEDQAVAPVPNNILFDLFALLTKPPEEVLAQKAGVTLTKAREDYKKQAAAINTAIHRCQLSCLEFTVTKDNGDHSNSAAANNTHIDNSSAIATANKIITINDHTKSNNISPAKKERKSEQDMEHIATSCINLSKNTRAHNLIKFYSFLHDGNTNSTNQTNKGDLNVQEERESTGLTDINSVQPFMNELFIIQAPISLKTAVIECLRKTTDKEIRNKIVSHPNFMIVLSKWLDISRIDFQTHLSLGILDIISSYELFAVFTHATLWTLITMLKYPCHPKVDREVGRVLIAWHTAMKEKIVSCMRFQMMPSAAAVAGTGVSGGSGVGIAAAAGTTIAVAAGTTVGAAAGTEIGATVAAGGGKECIKGQAAASASITEPTVKKTASVGDKRKADEEIQKKFIEEFRKRQQVAILTIMATKAAAAAKATAQREIEKPAAVEQPLSSSAVPGSNQNPSGTAPLAMLTQQQWLATVAAMQSAAAVGKPSVQSTANTLTMQQEKAQLGSDGGTTALHMMSTAAAAAASPPPPIALVSGGKTIAMGGYTNTMDALRDSMNGPSGEKNL